jgi:predicted 2-oxoglutarate/Fe(II)-dependent dioxygenase YbiX
MIQRPERGGAFEYVKDVRNADNGEMNYEPTEQVLNGETPSKTLAIDAGALVLFRGRNSMHRVTPVVGGPTRILAVLAYNIQPEVSLSESVRRTFYGRLR